MALNEKQERFVREYVVDLNATQAAIRAGYSERTAYSQGSRLMGNMEVRDRVRELKEELQERTEITRDRLVEELSKVAFGDIRGVLSWDESKVTLRPSGLISDDDAASIAEVTESSTGVKVKRADKIRAIDLLSKLLGFYDEKQAVGSAPSLVVDEP